MQNNTILPLLSNISKKDIKRAQNLNECIINNLQNIAEKNYECKSIPAGNSDSYSEFVDIRHNYEELQSNLVIRSPVGTIEN